MINLHSTCMDRADPAIRTKGRSPATAQGNSLHGSVRTYLELAPSAGCNGTTAIPTDRHLPLWQGVPVDSFHRCPVTVQVLDLLLGLRRRQRPLPLLPPLLELWLLSTLLILRLGLWLLILWLRLRLLILRLRLRLLILWLCLRVLILRLRLWLLILWLRLWLLILWLCLWLLILWLCLWLLILGLRLRLLILGLRLRLLSLWLLLLALRRGRILLLLFPLAGPNEHRDHQQN